MGRGGAGGPVISTDGVDLVDVPNKPFILLVAAFSALGGLLFGYDTGINGGVQVSGDFVEDFCVSRYHADDTASCSCYKDHVLVLAYDKRVPKSHGTKDVYVAEPGWEDKWTGVQTIRNATRGGTNAHVRLCVARDGGKDVRWACDCKAPKEKHVPTRWSADKGSYVSLLSFGAMFGALSAGQLAELLGRRKTISASSLVFVLGTLVCVIADGSMSTLLIGRVLIGAPIGSLSAVLPMYASEIAPKQIRGLLGTLFQLAIVVGILIATIVAIFIEHMAGGWKFALGIAALPAAILAGGIWKFPESPRWLLKGNQQERAVTALMTLRASTAEEVSEEMDEMKAGLDAQAEVSESSYKELVSDAVLRKRLCLAVGLQVLQQATGVNAIFYFAPSIFQDAGVGSPLLCGAATGLANLFGTFVAMRLIDSQGRRTLLIKGAFGMAGTMLFAALLLSNGGKGFIGYVAVLFICAFVINFAYSWGPICWIYPSEIFPMRAKSKAVSIATCGNWVTNMVFGKITPLLLALVGAPGVFTVFGLCGVLCGVFVIFNIPETKGIAIEHMDTVFANFRVGSLSSAMAAMRRSSGIRREGGQEGLMADATLEMTEITSVTQ